MKELDRLSVALSLKEKAINYLQEDIIYLVKSLERKTLQCVEEYKSLENIRNEIIFYVDKTK